MSVVKRATWTGAAALTIGLSLAGPQAVGIASADSPDGDKPSAPSASDSSSGGVSSSPEGHRGRGAPQTSHPVDSGTTVAPHRAPATRPSVPEEASPTDAVPDEASPTDAVPDEASPTDAAEIPGARGDSTAEESTANDSEHTQAPARGSSLSLAPRHRTPQPAAVTGSAAGANPAAVTDLEKVATTATLAEPAVRRPVVASAATPNPTPTVSAPPTLARASATDSQTLAISQAVTSFFDTASNWLTGLPNSPLSNLLEGALLMVRRTLFEAFPALNIAQTTAQSAPPSATYDTDELLRTDLLDLAKRQYGDLFGTTVPVYGYGPYHGRYSGPSAGTDAAGRGPVSLNTSGATAPSSTNTQVDGVDEADYVENDGTYIYAARNGQLTIVRAEDMSMASQSTLTGSVVGQYLAGDRLTVVSQNEGGWFGPMVKMAYGPWRPWKPQTTVTVYDVADRTAPTVVTQTTFDGGYQSSRAVDGTVYLVLQRSLQLPEPEYTETPIAYFGPFDGVPVDDLPPPFDDVVPLANGVASEAKIRFDPSAPIALRTYETWDSYVARVGDNIVNLSLPHAYSVAADGATVDLGVITQAADIVRQLTLDQQSLVTVVSVDSTGGGNVIDSVGAMVSGWASTVYMNSGALYVATNQDTYADAEWSSNTRIDRFTVDGPSLGWQGTGVVPGNLINQFALDEKDGYLRVATHSSGMQNLGGIAIPRNDNGIYVLDTSGPTLDQVGQLTGLAPGEQLYAVRYVGDTAYLVTFLQTDPLFVIDVKNPRTPTLTGELVVPGFSNYLQSVGEGLLLGIGQERETLSGDTHLVATLFNVANGAQPTQIDREYLDSGYQWSWSDAQFDHHALLYTPQDGLLVVPVAASGYDPQTGYRYTQYLKVLRVGPTGLAVVGEIHPSEPVQRTVRIGDVLYAVGAGSVTAYRLSDLSEIGTTAAAPPVV